MSTTLFTAGNKGPSVRSDCFITLEKNDSGKVEIEIQSKVNVMYGRHIKELTDNIIKFYELKNCKILIEDTGACDFTIAARLEAVIRAAFGETKEYLLPMLPENEYQTEKERFRFSRLYLPGNSPALMLNAGIHKPNGVILDLEDSVAHDKKAETRVHVRNALRSVDFVGAERMVRINQLPMGLEDIPFIVRHNVNLILIPKCESAEQIHQTEAAIETERKKYGFTYPIWFMPIIESALGVEKAFEIAMASPNVVSLAIGLEDYTADLGVQRTLEGTESLYARMRLVNACKAAGIQPIDSVFSDVADEAALRRNVKVSKSLGFEGMGCIHPRQIGPIHESYAPEKAEIEKALKIIEAFNEAKAKGLGVISLGTKMIDAPVVKRALKTEKLARELGLIVNC